MGCPFCGQQPQTALSNTAVVCKTDSCPLRGTAIPVEQWVRRVRTEGYMPQDICMEINAMLMSWDAVGEHGNTTWALVKHVTQRLLTLEPETERLPEKAPEWRKKK